MKASAALALLACLADPAGAESVYLPECTGSDGYYDVIWHQGGFVFYPGDYGDDAYRLIIEDCPGNRVLRMNLPYNGTNLNKKWQQDEAFHAVIEKAIQSKRKYTLGQLATLAREQGARATLSTASDESCACEKYGTVNP